MTTTGYPAVPGLRSELSGGVLTLTLDRPERRNAIDDVVMSALVQAFERAGPDEEVRAVLLGGEGKHFCGGADIVARNLPAGTRPRPGSIQRRLPLQAHRLVGLVLSVQVPVVCAIKGFAAGLGFQLALAADFAVAAHDARLWEPFSTRGFTPDSGATWLLPRLAGVVKARELLLLGTEVSGRQAAEWGIIHRSVAPSDLEAEVGKLVASLATGPTVALGLTKDLLAKGASCSLEAQLDHEAMALELSSRTADFKEGLAAFTERRPPRFLGR